MKTLVYLTTRVPSQIAADLGQAGYKVLEAQAVSEVLHFCEREHIDAIVIGPDIEDPELIEAQIRETTIKLRPEATAKELVWELTQLFPSKELPIQ